LHDLTFHSPKDESDFFYILSRKSEPSDLNSSKKSLQFAYQNRLFSPLQEHLQADLFGFAGVESQEVVGFEVGVSPAYRPINLKNLVPALLASGAQPLRHGDSEIRSIRVANRVEKSGLGSTILSLTIIVLTTLSEILQVGIMGLTS
jgi:hypothetical protein